MVTTFFSYIVNVHVHNDPPLGNSEYQDVIQLFEECDNDWEHIKECWQDTRNTRLSMWQSKTSGLTIADIFESFPFLTDTKSDELILQDFYTMYPDANVSLNKWKKSGFINVLSHARSFRDDYARVIINEIDFKDKKGSFFYLVPFPFIFYSFFFYAEDKSVLTLVLIPYIIAHQGRRTPNGESASKYNIQESFINIYKVSTFEI